MAKTLLAWIGGLGLVSFGIAGLAAWNAVGDGVHVTVQPLDAVDPVQQRELLLEDSIQGLRSDLQALVGALEGNLGQLVNAMEAGRRSDRETLLQALRDLEGRLAAAEPVPARDPEVLAELATLRALLEDLSESGVALETGDLAEAAPAEVAAATSASVEDPSVPDPTQPGTADPGAGTPAAAADPLAGTGASDPAAGSAPDPVAQAQEHEPAPAPASFLSFSLPSDDFDAGEERDWEVLDGLSRVGFDAKSTLHDFTGATTRLSGTFRTRVGDPDRGLTGSVSVPLDGLVTGLEDRDAAMLEHLAAAEHPEALFRATGFRAADDTPDGRHAGVLLGELELRGVARAVEVPVTYSLDDAHRLLVEGEVGVHLPDHDIPVPNKLGMVKMDPDVRMWISIRAKVRSRAGAQGGGR